LCPYCSSVEIARSHRRGPIEKYLLRAINVRVYRCDDCNSRFYGFSRSEGAVLPKNHAA
jgi:DNA-directed RNA polymerase subunit RPC12/RpoP